MKETLKETLKETQEDPREIQILNAAKNVFQKKGMDGARMQEIADEAGINKALLHYYYRSKQQLFEAVFKFAFNLLAPQLNQILNDDSSIENKIRNFTSDYIDFIIKQPYLPSFIIHEINRNPQFIIQLQNNPAFPNLDKFKQQVAHEIELKIIQPISAEQLFVNILSLSIFPFVASPLIKAILKLNNEQFQILMNERKREVADFIINSIKK
jgi:AcrR family transcriptional regulator